MAVHSYQCAQCDFITDVTLKLGDDSVIPVCPADAEHTMKRKYQIGGAFIKW